MGFINDACAEFKRIPSWYELETGPRQIRPAQTFARYSPAAVDPDLLAEVQRIAKAIGSVTREDYEIAATVALSSYEDIKRQRAEDQLHERRKAVATVLVWGLGPKLLDKLYE